MDPQAKKRPTIDEVATRAGVAISTVSRVVNGLDRVHPQTRARILAVIGELGYQPSALARGLALQRTHTIGLIVPNVTDPFFSNIVRGVEEAATAAHYSLLISSQSAQREGHHFHHLFTQSRVDGLVLVAINVQRHELDQLAAQGLPVAVVQHDLGGNVPTFVADNYAGAAALAEHLVEHGYRRIAYITGTDFTPDSAERLRALRDVLARHGLSLPNHYVVPGTYMPGSGDTAMHTLLDLPHPPEAVFAANDQMAADAINVLRARGLHVPHDMAVVGFDDIPLASYTVPPLTTVRQPAYDMGRAAVASVLPAFPPPQLPRTLLPTELVIRASCGCVPPRDAVHR